MANIPQKWNLSILNQREFVMQLILEQIPPNKSKRFEIIMHPEISTKCPTTKQVSDSTEGKPEVRFKLKYVIVDEPQEVGEVEGKWFIVRNKDFSPIQKTDFPQCGTWELHFCLLYQHASVKKLVYSVDCKVDFNQKPIPPNAKVHVDKNHTVFTKIRCSNFK